MRMLAFSIACLRPLSETSPIRRNAKLSATDAATAELTSIFDQIGLDETIPNFLNAPHDGMEHLHLSTLQLRPEAAAALSRPQGRQRQGRD